MLRTAMLITKKDLLIEWRTRVVLWQVLPFGLVSLLLAGFAIGPRTPHSGSAAGLFSLILLFVTLVLVSRSHQIEQGRGVRSALATFGVDSGSFFLGKSLAVATELFVVSATLATVGSILWHFSARAALASVVPLVVMVLSLSLAGTLYGALAGSQSSVTLAAVVSLPAYAPILLCGSSWIRGIMLGSSVGHWAVMSCVITLVYGALGTLLYGVVEEI